MVACLQHFVSIRVAPFEIQHPPAHVHITSLPQMLREIQDEQRAINNNPAEMQAQAHASAVKRFTGGGFAVS